MLEGGAAGESYFYYFLWVLAVRAGCFIAELTAAFPYRTSCLSIRRSTQSVTVDDQIL